MPKRVFVTSASATLDNDPIEFDLGGQLLKGGTWSESFVVLPTMSMDVIETLGGGVLDGLIRASTAGTLDIEQVKEAVELVYRFMDAVLVDDDAARFRQVVKDKNHIVALSDIAEVIQWVLEVISGRPSNGQSTSQDGLSNTPSTSAAPSSTGVTPLPALPRSPVPTSSPAPSRPSLTGSPRTRTSPRSSPSSSKASSTRKAASRPPKPAGSTVDLTPPL